MRAKNCKKCGECCKGELGPFVFPQDIYAISEYLHLAPTEFLEKFCTLHSIKIKSEKLDLFTINSSSNGCVFLKDNLCSIYECRPFQCVNAPFNFLGKYIYWSHMSCVTNDDFDDIDTTQIDKSMFEIIVKNGYKEFF